jgi:hypothetical protein
MNSPNIIWQPQPTIVDGVIRPDIPSPQQILLKCPYRLVGFGGARGGGKTDGVLGKFGIKQQRYGKAFNGIFFRREMPGADDLIDRARDLYEPMGASYNKVERQFIFAQGGRLRFRPLLDESDASKLQGQSISDAAVEEAGNFPDPSPIWKLFGVLRSPTGIPTQLILTFNPGGSGHYWLRELFVKPAPLGMKTLYKTLPTGNKIPYIYIPSRVKDNPILLANDPGYIDALHMVGSPELVRAWLEGDFEIHEGSFFPEFGTRHIVEPFDMRKFSHCHKICGFDWGHNSPFCAVWGCIMSGRDDDGNEVPYPKGSIVIYREYTGKGIKNVEIAHTIAKLSEGENCRMVADTQIFNDMGNVSIAQEFHEVFKTYKGQQFWNPADKNRLAGWSQFRRRLGKVGSVPMLYVFTTCRYLLDTVPAAGINVKHPEEMDPMANDHGLDATRYMLQEVLLDSQYTPPKQPAVKQGVVRVAEFIKEHKRQHQSARI